MDANNSKFEAGDLVQLIEDNEMQGFNPGNNNPKIYKIKQDLKNGSYLLSNVADSEFMRVTPENNLKLVTDAVKNTSGGKRATRRKKLRKKRRKTNCRKSNRRR